MNKVAAEIVGWYGAAAVIIAYGLLSFNLLASTSPWYQMLNLTGALGILIISVSKKVYQTAALNLIWLIIALIAILNIIV